MPEIIGIFGGTFDPVHNGHTETISHLMTLIPFKKVIVVPDVRPPHRQEAIGSFEDRLAMTRLAFKNHKKVSVEELGASRSGPSYAISTVKEILKKEGNIKIVVIVGSDAFAEIDSWYRWKELLRLVNFVVMKRPGHITPKNKKSFKLINQKNEIDELVQKRGAGKVVEVKVKPLRISSSGIRENLGNGIDINLLVGPKVREYLISNKLYV